MVKISTVIQIIFAEKFVSQDFTIMATPGLSGPTNTCALPSKYLNHRWAVLMQFSVSGLLTVSDCRCQFRVDSEREVTDLGSLKQIST